MKAQSRSPGIKQLSVEAMMFTTQGPNPMDKTKTNSKTKTKPNANTNAAQPAANQSFAKQRRAMVEQLMAMSATEMESAFKEAIAAHQKPLTPAAEAQYRLVARDFCELRSMMDTAIAISGSLDAHAGKIDAEVERGMRQGLDTMLMAIAAVPPENQLMLIAKVNLLGQLGPALDQNANLRAMIMVALEQDTLRLSRMDPGFSVERTGPVH
jgi:hypothetical protein